MLRLTIAHCFPFLDTSLNNLLLLGQSVTWHKSKHRPTVNREYFRVLRAPLWRDSVWMGPPSLIHVNWNVKLMSSWATCWIDLAVLLPLSTCSGCLNTKYSHLLITLRFICKRKLLLGHFNPTPWQAETFIWCCLFLSVCALFTELGGRASSPLAFAWS